MRDVSGRLAFCSVCRSSAQPRLGDVVLLVPFLYASVQTLAPCTALSSLQHGHRDGFFSCIRASRGEPRRFFIFLVGSPPKSSRCRTCRWPACQRACLASRFFICLGRQSGTSRGQNIPRGGQSCAERESKGSAGGGGVAGRGRRERRDRGRKRQEGERREWDDREVA